MDIDNNSQRIVYIMGIMRRSGTNFLGSLIGLHPDCIRVQGIWEDFLVANSGKLGEFVRHVTAAWNPEWDSDGRYANRLGRYLGAACESFLVDSAGVDPEHAPRYVVAKTPTVQNMGRLALFPHTMPIVVIRDGRDVVESGMRSFGWKFDDAVLAWNKAAQTIIRAQKKKVRFLPVRYEDLVHDLDTQMRRIFEYLDLDPGRYDFQAAADLPVLGSSDLARAEGRVHWEVVQKSADFNPVRRWAAWNPEQLKRFDQIAGAANAYFGYRDGE